MKFFYPKIKRSHLPLMAGISLLGGLLGGIYGALHDLITYSISDEYFTRLKFAQFSHIDMGSRPQVFAAQIGFIAAAAVGLAAGWFVARTAVPVWPARVAFRKSMSAFLLMIMTAASAGAAGDFIGLKTGFGGMLWNDLCASLDVSDVPAFLRVALIHTAGYVGALAGLVLAIIHLRRAGHPS
jgi:hypothetical protein